MIDWERNWRGNGVIAAVLFIVSYVIYGSQPKVGASTEKLVAFYDGDRTRILIASVVFGFAILCLMWFAAAIAERVRRLRALDGDQVLSLVASEAAKV